MSVRASKKKQRHFYSGKKKRHTQKAQLIADKRTGKIIATAFCEGKKQDFALFKESRTMLDSSILSLADSGYQGIDKLHANSQTPKKKSKLHPFDCGAKSRQPRNIPGSDHGRECDRTLKSVPDSC